MINQIRNFIINLKMDPQVERPPWDRFMPDDFRPVRLPADLESVRSILTGQGDYWDRSFRSEHVMSVVNSPRYKNHVTFFFYARHQACPDCL